ncbi:methyltransferase family protein [Konateibacter massiliensis]|uniref:methyltransferase family protein n=1 Tax=Konateibacter massiliensis TaxID=2002841 RepID=UPI000C15F37C|nr:isoprenylcysteine carboxylmethyltransferase family protein [Konateibacter massiliensis]
MNKNLLFQAIVKFLSGLLLVSVLLFIPAGTVRFWNAWLFIAVLFVPMFIAGVVLWIKKPELLAKRMNTKEKEAEQKSVILLSGCMFIAGFIIAALDFRFEWLHIPTWLVVLATVIFLVAYVLYAEVLRENTYLSRTVEVQENQKVIDTGLYGIVRHPMYSATILLFLSIPIILGSVYSFIVFMVYPVLLVKRILNEEKVLEAELEGYMEYKQTVKYRLIPFIW